MGNMIFRKNFLGGIAAVLTAVVLCLSGCSGKVEPFQVILGDTVIVPGQTTLQELADAGYDFADVMGARPVDTEDGRVWVYESVYDLSSEAEANTIYAATALVKEGSKVANVGIVNRSQKNAPLSECIICSVTVYEDCAGADESIIQGISFWDISVDKLEEIYGEHSIGGDSWFKWSKGDYGVDIHLNEDGTLHGAGASHNEW